MSDDLTELLGRKEVFWGMQDVAKENPKILRPGALWDWMSTNYFAAVTVTVRSFTDQDKRSRSLWRILYEMLENPGSLSREFHVGMYRRSTIGPEWGHQTFDSLVGCGKLSVPIPMLRSDLRTLEDSTERIRRLVNKRIAHRAHPGALRRVPRVEELDDSIAALDTLFCKYNLLLTAQGMDTLHATRQYNWQEVLYEPWIPAGSRLRPDSEAAPSLSPHMFMADR